MGKRIKANLYTETKIIWNGYEHLAVRNDDGTLFSQGHYKTRILPADLPEWYVYGRYYSALYRPDNRTRKCPALLIGAGHFSWAGKPPPSRLPDDSNTSPAAGSAWQGGM